MEMQRGTVDCRLKIMMEHRNNVIGTVIGTMAFCVFSFYTLRLRVQIVALLLASLIHHSKVVHS